MKYLEYETNSGRIISVVTGKKKPEEVPGKSFYEVGEDENIDISRYVVRGGVLVKSTESHAERQERERVKKEHGARCRSRLSAMIKEYVIAQLDEDTAAQASLIKEYRKIKRCL